MADLQTEWEQAKPLKGLDAEWEQAKPVADSLQPTGQQQDQPGMFESINKPFINRWDEMGKILTPEKPESIGETLTKVPGRVFDLVGKGPAGLINDIVGAGISKVAGTAYDKLTSSTTKQTLRDVGQYLANTDVGKRAISTVGEGVKGWEQFKKDNPEWARHIESATNIAFAAPLIKPIMQGASATGKAIGRTAGEAAFDLETAAAKNSYQDALNMVMRKPSVMSKEEKLAAFKSGNIEESPILKGLKPLPTERDKEIAATIQDVVDSRKSIFENRKSLQNKIAELGDKTQDLPKFVENKTFDVADLDKVFEKTKADSSVIFGSDKALESNYDSVIDEFKKILNGKKDFTFSNVLQTRKEFDQVIRQKFPKLFDKISTDNVRANAVRDVRMAANDFIADRIPDGTEFKTLLRQQSNMYKAIDGIARNNVSALDRSKFGKLADMIKRHPFISIETAGAIGGLSAHSLGFGSAIANVITNPVSLSALAAYGSYRVGKRIITSPWLRGKLVQFLRTTEEKLAPAEKKAVQGIILQLDGFTQKGTITGSMKPQGKITGEEGPKALPPGSQDFEMQGWPKTEQGPSEQWPSPRRGTPVGPGTTESSVVPKPIERPAMAGESPTPIRPPQEPANFFKGTIEKRTLRQQKSTADRIAESIIEKGE